MIVLDCIETWKCCRLLCCYQTGSPAEKPIMTINASVMANETYSRLLGRASVLNDEKMTIDVQLWGLKLSAMRNQIVQR